MRRFCTFVSCCTSLAALLFGNAALASGPVVFVSERDGNRELYTTSIENAAVTRLTNNGLEDISPEWSPDGERIAFSRGTHSYTIAADGSDLQGPLGIGVDRALDPTWSPDGLKLAVQVSEDFGAGDDWEIYTMDADGMNFQPLTVNINQDRYPDWSPDGSAIAIARDNVLTIIDATTGMNIMSYPAAGTARYPAWSPDGTKIAYSRAAAGWNLAILDVASGMFTDIVSDGASNFWPAWSPNGSQLIFASNGGDYDLYAVNSDGSNPTPLPANSVDDDFYPHWRAGSPEPLIILVPRDGIPPVLDGEWPVNDWQQSLIDDAVVIDLNNGQMRIQHNRQRLYIQFNMLGDDVDDPIELGGGDEFWLIFDVDRDGQITGNLDRRYRLFPETGNLRYETFMPGAMDLDSFNPPAAQTFSARGQGFGCFVPDDTLGIFPFHCDEHRLWEVAIDLRELNAIPGSQVNMGLMVKSGTPAFEQRIPTDLLDLESYIQLTMRGGTGIEVHESLPLIPNPVEPTQAIQDPNNLVDLAQGKDTVVRVSLGQPADYGTAVVNLFGQRDGVDLPGSPLSAVVNRNPLNTDPRSDIGQTAQLPLPPAWTSGTVSMWLGVRQPWIGSAGQTSPVDVNFVETVIPTYWVVPFDTGPAGMPNIIQEVELRRDELETVSAFPLRTIEYVRRPIVRAAPSTANAARDLMKGYSTAVILAWGDAINANGTAPFELPDQLIGAFPFDAFSLAGISDPVYIGGNARVVVIRDSAHDQFFAHELNHNLDTRPPANATWGRHVPNMLPVGGACGTDSPSSDPAWPYDSDDIQQFGWANPPQFAGLVVSNEFPDFMSYCRASNFFDRPKSWISPYRWQNLLDVFALYPPPGFEALFRDGPMVTNVLFVNGQVFDDNTGELAPVILGSGMEQLPTVPGDYEVRFHACDDTMLGQWSFMTSFVGSESQVYDVAPFSFILPDPGGVCSVRLLLNGNLLDQIVISPNEPVVNITSPNGGESWTGEEVISWNWSDADGDDLSATLLYISDDAEAWLPIASGISDTSYTVDSLTLPGNDTARIKIIVTDGLNTSSDVSNGTFTVAPKPPIVRILTPGIGNRVTNERPVQFQGSAWTVEGFAVPESQLIWYLDGEEMGVGETTTASLDIGIYTVELSVIEDGTIVATDILIFEVVDAVIAFKDNFENEK